MGRIYDFIGALFEGARGLLPAAMERVLCVSAAASAVILCVLLARLLLRRAPKIFSYALWAVVLFRLICPVEIPSPIAIIPGASVSEAAVETHSTQNSADSGADRGEDAAAHTAAPVRRPSDTLTLSPGGDAQTAATQKQGMDAAQLIAVLWLGGIGAVLLFSLVSLIKLNLRLREALRISSNIFICDRISTPFVMGIVRPRIYLPSGLGSLERSYIIMHEQHHIKRLDHIVKPIAFAVLCIHWFNPLVWLAFTLAMRDMEMSCDEAVLRQMGRDIRTDYSMSLLALATGRRMYLPAPLAFGESDTKVRIKNIVAYRKPALIVVVCAALAVTAACGVLGGSRTPDEPEEGAGAVISGAVDAAAPDAAIVKQEGFVMPDTTDTDLPDAALPHQVILSKEEQEAAYRAQMVAQTPGLSLTEGAGLPYSINEAAAFQPKDIHNITEAYLLCNFGLLTLSDTAALEALSQSYMTAEKLPDEPACGFDSPMFLKRADGAVGYVYPAGDDCGTFKAGDSYYQCTDTMFDFYGLFAMGSESVTVLDAEGRTVEVHSFHRLSATSSEYYIYDGALLSEYCFESDFCSHTGVYSHDQAGLLVRSVGTTQYETGETEAEEYVYAYDARGNCTSITVIRQGETEESVYSYKYDDSDRLIERQLNVRGTVWPSEVYEYDAAGNCVKVVTVSAETGEAANWMEYSYDDQGRPVRWDHFNGDGSMSDRYYNIQVYAADGSSYQQVLDLNGNVVETTYLEPPTVIVGPFFYQ